MAFNYENQKERKDFISDVLNSNENKARKNISLMQYEIYKSRQHPFVVEKIRREMGEKAAQNSRIISSINLTPKIVDEQAKVYLRPPKREFSGLDERQTEHANKLYEYCKANVKFKKANKIFKLQQQAAMQIVLRDGKIDFRPLYQHQYDVVPFQNDPEKAEAYIISSYDKNQLFQTVGKSNSFNPVTSRGYMSDTINQGIGDPDDYMGNQLFYWWTNVYNFVTDKSGNILSKSEDGKVTDADILNPIGDLPFIDIAFDKDFEFFLRAANASVDFTLDFSMMLSDQSEIARLQGFAQAILTSVEEPKDLRIGPRNYLWLKLDPNATDNTRPNFAFASPNPDIASMNQANANMLSMFLTSIGLSPKAVNPNGEKESYTSGVDRYLSMLERFEASADDYDVFKWVEKRAYELVKKWNNVYYNATENGFIPELSGVSLPEDSYVDVKFSGPEMQMSESEKLAMIQQKMEMGLMSRVQAVMLDQGVNEEMAQELIEKIDSEMMGEKEESEPVVEEQKESEDKEE
jgi:hypothetical protein